MTDDKSKPWQLDNFIYQSYGKIIYFEFKIFENFTHRVKLEKV